MSEFFNLGLGCGFIVGILVVFSALLFKDGWRISYFSLLDQLYNIIYVIFFVACLRPIRMRTVK
jgi:hypothetical protein